MRILTNINFLSLEFDFSGIGNIDAVVFVDIDNDGDKQKIEHKLQLHESSFLDFLTQEQVQEVTRVGDNFNTFIQSLRYLVTLKVANDLGAIIADNDYIPAEPLRKSIEELEARTRATEDALVQMMLEGVN